MLQGLPLFHFFDCGNSYCGEHEGMRYKIEPQKTEEGKELVAIVWPEPWCLEKTKEALRTAKKFTYGQEGLDEAIAWLAQQYESRRPQWEAAMNLPWDQAVSAAGEKQE